MEGGLFSLKRTATDSMIEVEYEMEWDGRAVSPAGYAEYRAMILDASDRGLTRLVLAEE
jgi:hypothetical protein